MPLSRPLRIAPPVIASHRSKADAVSGRGALTRRRHTKMKRRDPRSGVASA